MSAQKEIAKTIRDVKLFVLRNEGHRIKIGPYKFILLLSEIGALLLMVLLIAFGMWLINLIVGR
jgi:hypothetical protein